MKMFNADECTWWLDQINSGIFNEYDPVNGTFYFGVAILEYDWIDIELNMFTDTDFRNDGYTEDLVLSYFCCVKGVNDDGKECWSDAGYLDDFGIDVEVNFEADNWKEQLEADMEKKLKVFAERFDLKYDEPNWRGSGCDFDVFYRIHG